MRTLFHTLQIEGNKATHEFRTRHREAMDCLKIAREQLKEIRLLLDSNGYSEATLKTAWRNQTNQDIAASILGYIRRAALGEALVPFQQRVDHAMQRIYAQRTWTPVQRQWLERLAKRLDKMLGGQLDAVMGDLAQHLWESA